MAVRWQLVEINPVRAAQAPTPDKPELVTPTPAQLRDLAEAAAGTQWEIAVLLATVTGARRGELLAMRWSNVDLDRGRIRIVDALQRLPGGQTEFVPPKTSRAIREVPITRAGVERLRRHRVEQAARRLKVGTAWEDHDLVVERGDGHPVDPSTFTHAFTRIAQKAGLPGCRLHDCRHAVATMLANSGTPLATTSKILGHSSPTFTASVYQHPDDEAVERALQGLEQAFGS